MSTSPSVSPPPLSVYSVPASTVGTSPPAESVKSMDDVDLEVLPSGEKALEDEDFEERYKRLTFLLNKSSLYASMLQNFMENPKAKGTTDSLATSVKINGKPSKTPKNKRLRVESSDDEEEDARAKRSKLAETNDVKGSVKFPQPALITGATLRDYQLEGVAWMVSLHKNGISGILADEMGLGKTLQTIAFNAYLRERHVYDPFLVVCPLSVLHNWAEEFKKFAPSIPVCMYHGLPEERKQLRKTVMRYPGQGAPMPRKPAPRPSQTTKSATKGATRERPIKGRRQSGRSNKQVESEDEDEPESEHDQQPADDKKNPKEEDPAKGDSKVEDDVDAKARFPVILTTYEILMRDRPHLAQFHWGYIVVDEGHRLKNFDCKLMQEMKKLKSGSRLILTGTPLHNNLAELWSLLNFILPDIFHDLDSFQEWFNISTMQSSLSTERSTQLIHSLHAILKPFLLRRLKADVEAGLPPKKEYVLYAPLSIRQKELYDAIVKGCLRTFLIGEGTSAQKSPKSVPIVAPAASDDKRQLRPGRKSIGNVDGDDDEWFEHLENGGRREEFSKLKGKQETDEIGRDYQRKAALKLVNNMKLQNAVMQLRKVCSHPFLFDWPLDPKTREYIVDEQLVNASGKMMVLNRLLDELFRRKHKVLLFSQFTTMLDIIEDWATEFKGWPICRIDGSTKPLARREEMNRFQQGGDARGAPCLFLLSTRAGGLGINLVAADTVIFYDQDWNPQMDIQAQDRAHRIGQTKPVLIFRLVSKYTIEEKIMQKANEKRKLEALVIAKGKFRMPAAAASNGKAETIAELAASLLKLEGEKIEVVPNTDAGKAGVISDEALDALLDRSPEVFAGRGVGWTSKEGDAKGATSAFKVYEGPVDEGNDALARMMGEEVEC